MLKVHLHFTSALSLNFHIYVCASNPREIQKLRSRLSSCPIVSALARLMLAMLLHQNAWKLPVCAFVGLIDTCPFTNTHGNYHSACLSRSYKQIPIYKHSKLQCMEIYKHSKLQHMEISTLRAFLGLIGICPFTNTPSYNAWKTHTFLGLRGICRFTNTPSYSAWKLPLHVPF